MDHQKTRTEQGVIEQSNEKSSIWISNKPLEQLQKQPIYTRGQRVADQESEEAAAKVNLTDLSFFWGHA